MKGKLEYRKASAKVLKLNITCDYCHNGPKCDCGQGSSVIYFYHDDRVIDGVYVHEYWKPDKNPDHMLMVWKWLLSQNARTTLTRIFDSWIINKENIKLATMEAFMEYIK